MFILTGGSEVGGARGLQRDTEMKKWEGKEERPWEGKIFQVRTFLHVQKQSASLAWQITFPFFFIFQEIWTGQDEEYTFKLCWLWVDECIKVDLVCTSEELDFKNEKEDIKMASM